MQNIGVFNTSIGSGNLGDHIIMDSVLNEISSLVETRQQIHFSSHDAHLYNALKLQKKVIFNFLCGTNCLSSNMWYRPAWAVNLITAGFLKPTITLGVGWGGYQEKPDIYTRKLLNKTLLSEGYLSVRDNYTKLKMEEAGVNNSINTACLTMWGLNKEFCQEITKNKMTKSRNVVYTLTDYTPDLNLDFLSLKILVESYEMVYIWIQGARDFLYLKELIKSNSSFFLKYKSAFKIVPPVLKVYDHLLEWGDVDYVGTRLHGGIRALQKGVRTIIIGVDNRALEKKKDFNLPVIAREGVEGLSGLINSSYNLDINLPIENIDKFKKWLSEYNNNFKDDCILSYYSR